MFLPYIHTYLPAIHIYVHTYLPAIRIYVHTYLPALPIYILSIHTFTFNNLNVTDLSFYDPDFCSKIFQMFVDVKTALN